MTQPLLLELRARSYTPNCCHDCAHRGLWCTRLHGARSGRSALVLRQLQAGRILARVGRPRRGSAGRGVRRSSGYRTGPNGHDRAFRLWLAIPVIKPGLEAHLDRDALRDVVRARTSCRGGAACCQPRLPAPNSLYPMRPSNQPSSCLRGDFGANFSLNVLSESASLVQSTTAMPDSKFLALGNVRAGRGIALPIARSRLCD